VSAAIAAAAALAGAAPIAGQMVMPGGTATERAVAISDAGFTPGTVVVAPGQHVTWTNGGAAIHTVTADAGQFDSGNLTPKATFDFMAPTTTGSFPYHCTYHAFMRGTVVVSALSFEGPPVVALNNAAAVHGEAPGTAAATTVVIEALTSGAWTQVATTTVAADGTFNALVPALTTRATLRARVGADISPTIGVNVAPRLTAKRAGKRSLTVTVTPARAGKARLERLNLDTYRWGVVRRVQMNDQGSVTVRVPRRGIFRVTVLAAGGLSTAGSPDVTFR
jgi:plastocyanin